MSAEMPELGSKISLISKADIRYEGRLFTVDPRECTIALASVRSFGTEDRETKYQVAPQNQVYDYILFRGADIKDIRVVNNNVMPNDPAIMQLSVPPTLGPQPYQQPGFGHPVLGHMAPQMSQFQPYGGGGLGPIGANLSGAGLAPGMGMQRGVPKQQNSSVPINVLDLISGGSRSTTPVSLTSRKSPTNDAGTQVTPHDDKKGHRSMQPPGQQRIRRESGGRQPQQYQGNMPRNPQQRNPNQPMQPGGHERMQQGQRQQAWGNNNNRGMQMRPRGRGRGMPSGYRVPGQAPNQPPKAKNTLKFDSEFDFEQANTEFEELRSKLAKVKIEEPNKSVELNGDVEKKDDSGNETGAGEGEVEEETESFYDSKKSFFDNISCEAVERSKGRSQRTDWRTERKLNSETFGVASARRGGYRGRGGYYNNRGMGGGYRGGYRNYRNQGQNPRNNRPNQPPFHQQNQEDSPPQSSTSTTLPSRTPAPSGSSGGGTAIAVEASGK